MPSKKRKYNARFPAGRIKKIMQTDEEVGKVAQAVPIIIFPPTPRTLELFVESLLSKALQVTVARNAKTLSPSHVKQCILAESRFDFLRDLVKNIPDVSAAEEKEMQMSAESSPNSSRHSDMSVPPRRIAREDSNSSSSSEIRGPRENLKRAHSAETEPRPRTETITSITSTLPMPSATLPTTSATLPVASTTLPIPPLLPLSTALPIASVLPSPPALPLASRLPHSSPMVTSNDAAIDLTTKREDKPIRTANFYQETLVVDQVQHKSVIKLNPTYSSPQPSTSNFATPTTSYAILTPVDPVQRIDVPKPEIKPLFYLDVSQNNNITKMQTPRTPVTPILNIDFSKNLDKPEIKVLDTAVANIVGVKEKKLQRQNSRPTKDIKKEKPTPPVDIDHINSGNLQIDEDYDT